MKIGFISILGERGQWHVTKNFMNALQHDHELFLLARPFHVRDGTYIGDFAKYDIKANIKCSPTYQLSREDVEQWVIENDLDIVVFNEEYDWGLVAVCNKHAKVVTYLDYFTADQIQNFNTYDLVIACAKHAHNVFTDNNIKRIKFINWGVDNKLFKPTQNTDKFTFFHSAGWGGINWRKCSPDVLKTFDRIRKKGHDFTMHFHSQTDLHFYDQECKAIIDKYIKEGCLKVTWGTVEHPGLYHTGVINVAPSILEGLGLFLPEGLSCGMPTITTDAEPMNQFVSHNVNGLLIKTTGSHYRKDPYYFPEYDIDVNSLEEMMITLGSDHNMQRRMSEKAREGILEVNALEKFNDRVITIFNELK